ncbi:MAG: substrate-binding domain-containing protein [Burkholderiaceae bacterium]
MKNRGIHLQYTFQHVGQQGAEVQNPLFDLLSALREHGSIQHAARHLGQSYRHVWGSLKHWQEVLGEPLVTWAQGQPARLTPFAERLVWAEQRARARLTPHIEALRAELERVLAEALDGTQQVLTLFASHDMALPLLRERALAGQHLHIELKFAGSLDALRALNEGRCLVAGFHVPPLLDDPRVFARGLKPLLKPGRHKLIGCMRRMQGLMVAHGNPLKLRDLTDLRRADGTTLRFIQRQSGSGTRLLTDHLFSKFGIRLPQGDAAPALVEDSHVAVAAAIASALADAGVGIEAAARAFGLGFVPLIEEDYFLVSLADALEHPAVAQLRAALETPGFADALHELPGYTAVRSGEILSLTRALPWWNFRHAKSTAAAVPPKAARRATHEGR